LGYGDSASLRHEPVSLFKRGDIMKIYDNAIETERAFIHFNNVQHISWNKYDEENVEVKIHSMSNFIIQVMKFEDAEYLLTKYKVHMGVKGYGV